MKSQAKYLFYIDSMQKGGANRVMANLVDFFANQDYETILINDIIPDNRNPVYSVNPKVKRLYLSQDVLSTEKSNIKRVIGLRKIINEEKPETILSFLGPPNFRLLIASIGLNCKKVVSVRNDPLKEYGRKKVQKWIAGLIFSLADGCVFQTEEASIYFPQRIREKGRVIYNPVCEAFFNENRIEEPHDIITVGRLEKQKNHELLIEAFALIADKFPEEKLIIYGEGSLRKKLENQIVYKGLIGRVELPGSVSNVANRLKQAKCFVLSSNHEGMPNALMEAMAVGIPVISTDCPCGGPKMLIQKQTQGLLVKCGDPIELAEKMETILSDAKLQRKMSKAAKERAKEFNADKILLEWEHFLRQ